jgi:VanZ family protein
VDDVYAVPMFVPGMAVTLVAAALAARPLARFLDVDALVATVLLLGFGAVLSATLTPSWDALRAGVQGSGVCDLSRIGLAPLSELRSVNDTSLNVILFMPLGVALGALPATRRTAVVVAIAFALPFVIEGTQLVVPALDRACQTADLFDNVSGLVLGGGIALVSRAVLR